MPVLYTRPKKKVQIRHIQMSRGYSPSFHHALSIAEMQPPRTFESHARAPATLSVGSATRVAFLVVLMTSALLSSRIRPLLSPLRLALLASPTDVLSPVSRPGQGWGGVERSERSRLRSAHDRTAKRRLLAVQLRPDGCVGSRDGD